MVISVSDSQVVVSVNVITVSVPILSENEEVVLDGAIDEVILDGALNVALEVALDVALDEILEVALDEALELDGSEMLGVSDDDADVEDEVVPAVDEATVDETAVDEAVDEVDEGNRILELNSTDEVVGVTLLVVTLVIVDNFVEVALVIKVELVVPLMIISTQLQKRSDLVSRDH